ncbi:hypothetical protein BCR34DRAFT_590466 [Clohesyomyces aquaticus]|uniref:Extracellular membrane protein CFEM domain-containing protein n=1 Tax=Clohesyomyces aquaticus TaxID=1231657 RepID=A0A1Y1Z9E0_9PLEO|nr:hypothetical protein BCR34DRAFT_590466 [Clohesyomyces aquaticus]
MRPTAVPFTLFAFISASRAAISNQATEVATIKLEPGWKALPSCINHCIWDVNDEATGAIGGDLAYHMGCPNPWYNGCYCRPQSAAVAYSFISSCASYLCSTPSPGDIASGTSVYVSYCSKVLGSGYTPAPIVQAAPTSDAACMTSPSFPLTGVDTYPYYSRSSVRTTVRGAEYLSRSAHIGFRLGDLDIQSVCQQPDDG